MSRHIHKTIPKAFIYVCVCVIYLTYVCENVCVYICVCMYAPVQSLTLKPKSAFTKSFMYGLYISMHFNVCLYAHMYICILYACF